MNASVWTIPLAIAGAMALDWWLGEPPSGVHPVAWMGRFLSTTEPWLLDRSRIVAFVGGSLAWCVGVFSVAAMAGVATGWLASQPFAIEVLVTVLLFKPMMAWRMLHDEVQGVEDALVASIPAARVQLGRLVSRDVAHLDGVQIRESAIETLAENLNDSVVAPLFWFAVAGLPGAAVYRFANTADAMWGYRGRREWVGKCAARADDLLSWIPARLTAALLWTVAGDRPAWAAIRADARLTPSPNGGWSMGAMARILDVRLAKPGSYTLHPGGRDADVVDTRRALALAARAAGLGAVLAMGIAASAGVARHAV